MRATTEEIERIVALEQRSKSNSHRIEQLEGLAESIQELAISTHEMAMQMKYMKDEQAELNRRLSEIEKKPADRLNTVVTSIISALAGAIVTGIVSAVLIFAK